MIGFLPQAWQSIDRRKRYLHRAPHNPAMEFYTPSKPNNSIGSPLGFRPPAPSAFDGPASFRQDRRAPQAVFVSGNLNAARSSSAPALRAQSFVQRPRPVSQPIYASGLVLYGSRTRDLQTILLHFLMSLV